MPCECFRYAMLIKDASLSNIMSDSGCRHFQIIQEHIKPGANGCEDCLKISNSWVHLRLCLICGHVECCDSSKNKHATNHFRSTEHPVIQSFEPNEDWKRCVMQMEHFSNIN